MKCNNCNKKLSCGCQRTVAKDGKSCCSKCVKKYNKNLTSVQDGATDYTGTLEKSGEPKTNVQAYFTIKK